MNSSSCTFDVNMLERQQFANVSRPSPMLRRASATEAFICVLVDESGRVETLCNDPEQESYSSLDFSFSGIKTHAQRQLEEFSESSEKEMRITHTGSGKRGAPQTCSTSRGSWTTTICTSECQDYHE
jgi:hypothetical protein